MSSIRTGIELQDNFSAVLNGILSSVNLAIYSMQDMHQSMSASVDTSALEGARSEIDQATMAFNELNAAMQNRASPDILPTPTPSPAPAPVEWQTYNGLEVFNSAGLERSQQEIANINTMLEQLGESQQRITQLANDSNILSPQAVTDIQDVESRIQSLQQTIELIENNPLNMGTDAANSQLERSRVQLHELLQLQDNLSSVMQEGMDVSEINAAYQQISQRISDTERLVRDSFNHIPPIPIEWQTFKGLEVFNSTGLERSQQEIASVNSMLERLNNTQSRIIQQANESTILSPQANSDIQNVGSRVQALQQMIEQIESNPLNIGTDSANAQLERLRMQLNQLLQLQDNLGSSMQGMDITEINVAYQQLSQRISDTERLIRDSFSHVPPVDIPITWQTDGLEVFTGTGMERFQQEVQRTNSMLEQLSSTQDAIARQAFETDFLPASAFQDLNSLAVRMDTIRSRIQQIENNPLSMGTAQANAELERLYSQLLNMQDAQNDLNQAMQDMDVSAANAAYLRLSQLVGDTERHIRDNVDEQERFNQEIGNGVSQANDLMNTIGGVVAAYVSLQSLGGILTLSDELTQTNSRLNMIRNEAETLEELQNKIYASAERSRASYISTASAVAQLANNAGGVFESNDEIIYFLEAVNKQFVLGSSNAESMSAAMTQLTQGLSAGALRGDELNSVLEGAPGIARAIEESMGWAEGSIKSYAEEGLVTAEVVKNAMLSSMEEINAQFECMPETWGQIWTNIQNDALESMQPILQGVNDLINSDSFQEVVNIFTQGIDTLANSGVLQNFIVEIEQTLSDMANSQHFQNFVNSIVQGVALVIMIITEALNLIGMVGGFIAENWSIISPVIYAVVAAMAAYLIITTICTIAKIAMCIASYAHAVATKTEASAAATATAAQYGLNTALLSCPLTWIILLIIALIAVIFAVCNAIAKMTGIANSGFGVITGGINVVLHFFQNLGLSIANIALGIGSAIAALASNILTAFKNAIRSVQSFWYDLLSTVLTVVAGICEALNKLPFVEFDYSGLVSAADDYAAKSAEAAAAKEDYTSISDAFNEGFNTFDTFQDGWISEAFNEGAAWGDSVVDKIKNFNLLDKLGLEEEEENPADKYQEYLNNLEGIGSGIDETASNTGSIADAMDIAEEDLKYLRDMAEQEVVNRYTVAEVSIDMSGMQNTVNNASDLDGFMSDLTEAVNEAVDNLTEGVHT